MYKVSERYVSCLPSIHPRLPISLSHSFIFRLHFGTSTYTYVQYCMYRTLLYSIHPFCFTITRQYWIRLPWFAFSVLFSGSRVVEPGSDVRIYAFLLYQILVYVRRRYTRLTPRYYCPYWRRAVKTSRVEFALGQ